MKLSAILRYKGRAGLGRIISITFFTLVFSGAAVYSAQLKDALSAFGGAKGPDNAHGAMKTFYKSMAKLKVQPRAKKFLDYVEDSLDEFDFEALMKHSAMKKRSDKYRVVTLQGTPRPNDYYISMANTPYHSGAFKQIGDIKTDWGLRENKNPVIGDRSFEGYVKAKAGLGQFNHRQFTDFLDRMLVVLDPNSIDKINAPQSSIYPGIGGPSRKLLNEFNRSYPNTAKFLNEYTTLKSLIKVKTHNGKRYTEYKMTGALKFDKVEDIYPSLAEWLEDVQDLFKLYILLNDTKGNNLTGFWVDPSKFQITWSFMTAGGKVLPSRKGKPVFNEAFTITGIKQKKVYSAGNFQANIYGLKFKTGNIIVFGQYDNKPDSANVFVKITKLPKMEVGGAFGGVIPPWLIDTFIPSNIETLINDFNTVVASANKGKGTRLQVQVKREGPGRNLLYANGNSEFLDNRWVRIGLKVWNNKFRPDDESIEEVREIFADYSVVVMKDIDRYR